MFKLNSLVLDNPTYDPAQEGLWDNIVYFFTTDKSVATMIGNMLYQMGKMEEDEKRALESTHIDYKMASCSDLRKVMAFSGSAVDFVVSKCQKYEGKSYALLEDDRKQMQEEIESEVSSFKASHDFSAIGGIVKNVNSQANKTYATLGYTFDNLYDVAKQFKDAQSGRLARMKKMKFISNVLGFKPKDGALRVVHAASIDMANILNFAMTCYKYTDKFLFMTYREMERQKLI